MVLKRKKAHRNSASPFPISLTVHTYPSTRRTIARRNDDEDVMSQLLSFRSLITPQSYKNY